MAFKAVGGKVRRLSLMFRPSGRKSSVVSPAQAPQQLVGKDKKLAAEMWLPNLRSATIDVSSDQIMQVARQTSATFGGDCRVHAAHHSTYAGAEVHLVGLVRNGAAIIGLYELSDYADGVLFKRVCDVPASELVRQAKLPADWPKKYEPVSTKGGSRKLPSSASVRDVLEARVAPA